MELLKRARSAVAGTAVLVVLAVLASRQALTYRSFLPVANQTGHPTTGIAWAPGWTVDLVRDDFGLYHYAHSVSHSPTWLARGGIPYLHPGNEAAAISGIRAANYCGWVIFLNEPDRPDQNDMTPAEAAAMYARVRPQLPCNRFAVGNPIDLSWLDAFLPLIHRWPGDVVGIHIYQDNNSNDPRAPGFVWPSEWIDTAVRIAAAHGWPSEIAVTEFGVPNQWGENDRRLYLRQVRSHPRVVLWLLYTSHCGGYSAHACQFNLYDEVSPRPPLTANGRMLQGYP